MTHLLLIVFFRWRSCIFRFDDSFFILPQIIYFTLNNVHLLWCSILGPSFQFSCARGEASHKVGQWTPMLQLQCNSFNIFSGAVDQIRSKKRNSKHVLHWSRLLLNIRWLKPRSEFLLISRKMKLFVYETYTIEKETFHKLRDKTGKLINTLWRKSKRIEGCLNPVKHGRVLAPVFLEWLKCPTHRLSETLIKLSCALCFKLNKRNS